MFATCLASDISPALPCCSSPYLSNQCMWANRGPGVSRGVSTSELTSQGRGGVLQLQRLSLYSGPISWDYGMSKQAMHDSMAIEFAAMAFMRAGNFWMG